MYIYFVQEIDHLLDSRFRGAQVVGGNLSKYQRFLYPSGYVYALEMCNALVQERSADVRMLIYQEEQFATAFDHRRF